MDNKLILIRGLFETTSIVSRFLAHLYQNIDILVRPLKKIYMFSVPARFLFGGRLLFFFICYF